MRSAEERKADFARREADRKAKYAAAKEARAEAEANRKAANKGDLARRWDAMSGGPERRYAEMVIEQTNAYIEQQKRIAAGEVVAETDLLTLPRPQAPTVWL
ncbi:hypothetical protein E3O55_08430 [Cryobacterium sp. MDB1-18-2]|uniref:hypothetical protein n=1 Tax=unclassified Cryobacterium TaxID=2649013 RepID=UPI00106C295C|nr:MULTISPECIES: hypothetical protein [unclassified Cryobacterium]TFC30102.1 hypothetical protein E3O55_08430 [Cryobacterium sp. MDB1-18-2]TFC41382.1 hypothetical protein E3O50_09870 [Cryobacterium sp. MDB1-18-1]